MSFSYFLHPLADKAAEQLCEQDVKRTLNYCLRRLQWSHKKSHKGDRLLAWVEECSNNYYWLAFFCEKLQDRCTCQHWSEIQSLRRHYPRHLVTFSQEYKVNPPAHAKHVKSAFPTFIAANRVDYFRRRQHNAKWRTAEKPSWWFRLEDSLLPSRQRQAVLRKVSPRLNRAKHEGSKRIKRVPLRNGQLYTNTGDDTGFSLWPLHN